MNDVDRILNKIRENSSTLASYHRKRFLLLKKKSKYFKLPIIVLSALNSVGAVSLQGFIGQTYISLINMFMSLIVGIIGSIELFYGITRQMEVELVGSKDFYVLSIDIYKYLALDKSKRDVDEHIFLSDSWTRYTKLIETSYVLKKKVEDMLIALPSQGGEDGLFVDTNSDDTGSP